MDTFFSMRVFTKVVETENFTKAARLLKLSAPMVTRHVRSLEQRLGTRLINRTTHRFSLTEAGAIYNERCIKLLSDMEEAHLVTSAITRLPRGRLRLSATRASVSPNSGRSPRHSWTSIPTSPSISL